MKSLFFLVLLITLCGCATPSKITRKFYDTGIVKSEVIEYKNSTFYSARIYGLDLGVDIDTKIPRFRGGIIKYESARVRKGQKYNSNFGFEDISLLSGSGSGHQTFTVCDEPED